MKPVHTRFAIATAKPGASHDLPVIMACTKHARMVEGAKIAAHALNIA
jgi:hypothetical protein